MPDWGGGPTLAHLIGSSAAADLILTARRVGADEALQLGLVNRISTPGNAVDEAVEMAETIMLNGPRAVQSALKVIRSGRNLSLQATLDLEQRAATDLIASGECLHGIGAFLTGQTPDFPDLPPEDPAEYARGIEPRTTGEDRHPFIPSGVGELAYRLRQTDLWSGFERSHQVSRWPQPRPPA